MEFINPRENNRKGRVYLCISLLSGQLALLLLPYVLEPFEMWLADLGLFSNDDVGVGITFSEFMFWSIALTALFLTYAVYSRIIRRVVIDRECDRFTIEYIDRFRVKIKTHTVKASLVHTQLDDFDNSSLPDSGPDFLGDNFDRYQNLYLIHKDFGTIMISTRDFGEVAVREITKSFVIIQEERAAKIRRKRELTK